MTRFACFSRQRGSDAKADKNDFLHAKRLAHPGGRFFNGTTPAVVRHGIIGVVERVPRAGIIETQRGEARRGEIIGEDAPRLMRAERLVTHGGAHDDATIAVGVVKPSEILADRDGRRHCQNQNPCCWDRELARPRLGRESFRRASAPWRRMEPVPKRRTSAIFVLSKKETCRPPSSAAPLVRGPRRGTKILTRGSKPVRVLRNGTEALETKMIGATQKRIELGLVTNASAGWNTVRRRWETDLAMYAPTLHHIEDHWRSLASVTERFGPRSIGHALAGRAAARAAIDAGAKVILLSTLQNAPFAPLEKGVRYIVYGDCTSCATGDELWRQDARRARLLDLRAHPPT